MKIPSVLAVFALLATCGANVASAQYPCGGAWGYGQFSPYYDRSWQRESFDRPPYFALYPPVYYSYPVARPYGYSPFALPPGVAPVEPQLVTDAVAQAETNPFFQPGADAPVQHEDRATKTALARPVVNPFYSQAERIVSVETAAKRD